MTTGAALTALAASALFALPASADAGNNGYKQSANRTADAGYRYSQSQRVQPVQYHQGRGYGGGRQHAGPGSKPFNIALGQCSRKAINRAWRKGAWSAQYIGTPSLKNIGPRQWKLVGTVRTHGDYGFNDRRIRCDLEYGEVVSFRPAGHRSARYRY